MKSCAGRPAARPRAATSGRSPRRAGRRRSRPSSSCGSPAGRRASTGSRRTPSARRSRRRARARGSARAPARRPRPPAHMPRIGDRRAAAQVAPARLISSGAVKNANASESSSGASFITSRKRAQDLVRTVGPKSASPPQTSGPSGCRASSSAVTTPKLPPPPRSAHSSSGFSSLGRADDPAVPRDELGGDEVVARQAVLALEPARAAAERQPGDAGRGDPAAGGGEAVRLRRAVDVGPDGAAADAGDAPSASTSMSAMPRRSSTMPSSHSDRPATECPPARTATAGRARARRRARRRRRRRRRTRRRGAAAARSSC